MKRNNNSPPVRNDFTKHITKPPPAVFVYLQIKKQKQNNVMYTLLIKNLRHRSIQTYSCVV